MEKLSLLVKSVGRLSRTSSLNSLPEYEYRELWEEYVHPRDEFDISSLWRRMLLLL